MVGRIGMVILKFYFEIGIVVDFDTESPSLDVTFRSIFDSDDL